jgi:tetratricopeptide (TPR) repeat protein
MSFEEGRKAFKRGDYGPGLAMLEDFFESLVGQESRSNGLRGDERQAFLELAQLHQRLDDDSLRSLELLEELVENDIKVFGADSRELAASRLELADAYQELEHPDLARAEQLVAEAEAHADPGLVCHARASIAFDRNDYVTALELLDRALVLVPDDDRERRALVLNLKALSHQEMGNFPDALKFRVAEMQLAGQVYGEDHPEFATSLESLADLYLEMRARAKSMLITQDVIRIRRAKLGEDSSFTLDSEEDLIETELAWLNNLSTKTDFRVCFGCDRVASGLKKCATCKQAWWCSEECQGKRSHAKECSMFVEMFAKATEKAEAAKKKKAGKKNSKGQQKKKPGNKPKKQ